MFSYASLNTRMESTSPFDLPEIIHEIQSYLHAIDRTCLALVNKTTYQSFIEFGDYEGHFGSWTLTHSQYRLILQIRNSIHNKIAIEIPTVFGKSFIILGLIFDRFNKTQPVGVKDRIL